MRRKEGAVEERNWFPFSNQTNPFLIIKYINVKGSSPVLLRKKNTISYDYRIETDFLNMTKKHSLQKKN